MSAKTKSVGLSGKRLERLDRFMQERYVDPGRLPGTLTLVHRRGETAHVGVAGHADRERGVKLAEDTVFRIYSMTKPVTSVAFMMLVEQGLVALDDPVHRFIPEWRDLGVYKAGFLGSFQTERTAGPMRMVDLLRHTAGLTYGFQQRTNVDAAYRKLGVGEIVKSGTLDGMISNLAKIPLEFSPATSWNYSVATDVLGYLVGKISGQPFEQYLRDKIFEPLGMRDTGFHAEGEAAERLASCYALGPDGELTLQDDAQTSGFREAPSFISGGGGLVSTAGDYLKFCRMLLNGGALDGERLLGPKTIALMTANHLPGGKDLSQLSQSLFSEAAYAGVGFGLGFATTTDVARTLIPGTTGDYFWGGAASTFFWIDPREELICVFMTQFMPSSQYPIRRELRTLVYSAITESYA